MAIEMMTDNLLAEMEQEIESAKQKSSSGNVFFFKLEDGQRALVRFLLDLPQAARVWKHEFYNPSTNKYEVSALCAESADVSQELCKHCADAKTNRKLERFKCFVAPIYVYGVRNTKTNEVVTYKDKEGQTHPVSGIRLLLLKGTNNLLPSLTENYRVLGDSFVNHDITISMTLTNGDKKKPNYTPIVKPASPFTPPEGVEVPEQSREDIVSRLLELWVPTLIGENTPPAQSVSPTKSAVPDF